MDDRLAGWIPMLLSLSGTQPTVDWIYIGQNRFVEPFCHDTLKKLASKPFNRLFRQQSELDLLLERGQTYPGLPLKGIVFHMSRCGSTLLAQWLAALSDSVVLAEPEPLDTLLQWPQPYSRGETLRALLAALGQPRRTGDRSLFLKTDCWHLLYLDRLLAAFPDTPWLFLYRNPLEVLASHQRIPGWQCVPESMAVHGLSTPKGFLPPLAYGAWVLGNLLESAKQAMARHSNGLLINYAELPAALENRIANHFGIDLSHRRLEELRAVTKYHAKRPGIRFEAEEKPATADSLILELSNRWLAKPYAELEQMRLDALQLS